MASASLKLTILLAVLVQYTPVQHCAVERMVLGANCHDRGDHTVLGVPHAGESSCGFPADGPHDCVCEQPKVDAQHDPQALKPTLGLEHVSIPAAVPLLARATNAPSRPDPDPPPGASRALQLPLLI